MMGNKWPVKQLGNICEVLNGFAFKSDKYVDKGVRVIRITNVQHGYIEDNDPKFYPINECDRLHQYMLKENDLLMSLTGNVGRVGLLDGKYLPAALNQRVACLRIKSDNVELKYLFHHFNSELFETRCIQSAKGIAQKNMSTEWLKEYPIPIPPLSEQSRIVEELDLLSNTIEKKRQQLSELDNLAQSIFYDMFILKYEQWERMALIDIYKFIDYRGKTPNKIDYGVPLITARNIRKGYIDYTIKEFISETEFQCRQSRGIAQKGDLLFTTEAPMGYAAIADLDTFSTGQRLITFQQRNEGVVSNIYVLYYILSDMFQTELNKQATGATVKGIKGSKLEKMIVPLPPLNLQQLFAQKIEAIEKEKELIKQSIKETEELFNSRMDYYFG